LDDGCFICTHVPVHPSELGQVNNERSSQRYGRWKANVHGHIHQQRVMRYDPSLMEDVQDSRYLCVSVEHISYKPVSLDVVRNLLREQLK
jgi:calcineurin-like phosphoesterase family protein